MESELYHVAYMMLIELSIDQLQTAEFLLS